MKKHLLLLFTLVFLLPSFISAQEIEPMEVFVIDSYVTPKKPYRIKILFYTSDSALSKIIIDNKHELTVSEKYTDKHMIEMPLSDYSFDSISVPLRIIVTDKNGVVSEGEPSEIMLPHEINDMKGKGSSIFTVCCFGGVIFGLPSPTYVNMNGEEYFGLAKEIPIFSFFSGGYNYPKRFVSLEYAHFFKAEQKNFMRVGYKEVIQIPVFEYISPGVSGFTDFKGFNGISPEITLGMFKVYNVFTFYGRYRYSVKPSESNHDFHEISIGLYSNFFSINI